MDDSLVSHSKSDNQQQHLCSKNATTLDDKQKNGGLCKRTKDFLHVILEIYPYGMESNGERKSVSINSLSFRTLRTLETSSDVACELMTIADFGQPRRMWDRCLTSF